MRKTHERTTFTSCSWQGQYGIEPTTTGFGGQFANLRTCVLICKPLLYPLSYTAHKAPWQDLNLRTPAFRALPLSYTARLVRQQDSNLCLRIGGSRRGRTFRVRRHLIYSQGRCQLRYLLPRMPYCARAAPVKPKLPDIYNHADMFSFFSVI